MSADKPTYKQRWIKVIVAIVAKRGLVFALGVCIGIIARRTAVDWDLRAELDHRERDC